MKSVKENFVYPKLSRKRFLKLFKSPNLSTSKKEAGISTAQTCTPLKTDAMRVVDGRGNVTEHQIEGTHRTWFTSPESYTHTKWNSDSLKSAGLEFWKTRQTDKWKKKLMANVRRRISPELLIAKETWEAPKTRKHQSQEIIASEMHWILSLTDLLGWLYILDTN